MLMSGPRSGREIPRYLLDTPNLVKDQIGVFVGARRLHGTYGSQIY